VPDRRAITEQLARSQTQLGQALTVQLRDAATRLKSSQKSLLEGWGHILRGAQDSLTLKGRLLEAFNPQSALQRGYAIVRSGLGDVVRTGRGLKTGDILSIELRDALIDTTVQKIKLQ
jgi:exodeoxyribonuclease VII large subunit